MGEGIKLGRRICQWCKQILGYIDWSKNDTHGGCFYCCYTEGQLGKFKRRKLFKARFKREAKFN